MARVKLCGTTNLDDARLAADVGAWAIGLIFVLDTPRVVDEDTAAEIVAAVRRQVETVGVFVNAPLDRVTAVADAVGMSMLQLHGDEGPAYCAEAARRTGCKIVKAARVRSRAEVVALEPFHTDFHLLDAHVAGVPGGTGATWDWELVTARRSHEPLIVAGGLTPDNVADAIRRTEPFAVDVVTGVEAQPGRKDPEKVEAFVSAARNLAPLSEAPAGGRQGL